MIVERRVDVREVAGEAYAMVSALERYTRRRVEEPVFHLIKLRASILNGCAFYIDMHTTGALDHGEDVRRLAAVAAWRESPFFDDRERAVLALTDAVTRLGEGGVPDTVWDDAAAQLGLEGAVDVLFAIATINVWNRLAVTSRMQPPALVAGTGGPAAA